MLLTLLQSQGVTPPPAPPPASGGKPLRLRPTKPPEMLEWVSDYVFDDAKARKRKRKRAEILLLMH